MLILQSFSVMCISNFTSYFENTPQFNCIVAIIFLIYRLVDGYFNFQKKEYQGLMKTTRSFVLLCQTFFLQKVQ